MIANVANETWKWKESNFSAEEAPELVTRPNAQF